MSGFDLTGQERSRFGVLLALVGSRSALQDSHTFVATTSQCLLRANLRAAIGDSACSSRSPRRPHGRLRRRPIRLLIFLVNASPAPCSACECFRFLLRSFEAALAELGDCSTLFR